MASFPAGQNYLNTPYFTINPSRDVKYPTQRDPGSGRRDFFTSSRQQPCGSRATHLVRQEDVTDDFISQYIFVLNVPGNS